MSVMAASLREVKASYAFIERNFNLTKRYFTWEIVFMVYSVVQALSILYIGDSMGVGPAAIKGPALARVILFLSIGALVWSYLSTVFEIISETITWERWEGTIEYTLMAPVSRLTHLVGTSLFGVAYSLLRTVLILGILSLFFHIDLSHANLLSSLVVVVLSSFSFIGLGIMAAVLPLLYTERGAQMTYVISSALLLVSGVYYPVGVLPGWMQVIGTVSPANYALESIRGAVMNGRSVVDLWPDVWPLLVIGAVTIPLGLAVFQRAERYAKRTGKLKRSG
ncbi:MAG TPA: ABC transporter permease [Chloroflexota bacterium]|nr:ABC transporter permease [Chloroflexota bacterium]